MGGIMKKAIKTIFSGRVQGVGFRYRTQLIAQQFPVTGYVKNLNDGTVELVIEGDDIELSKMMDSVNKEMMDNIRQATSTEVSIAGFTNFSIEH